MDSQSNFSPPPGSRKKPREVRRALAHESFEEEIRKVGQLIHLSTAVKTARIREDAPGTKNASPPRASTEKASVKSKL